MHEAEQEIQALIRGGENLAVEFKSDVKSLPDRDLVAAVVALARPDRARAAQHRGRRPFPGR